MISAMPEPRQPLDEHKAKLLKNGSITARTAAVRDFRRVIDDPGIDAVLTTGGTGLTGRDVDGFAEHDWRELAKSGSGAAIYMGVTAAAFMRGRLLMHGAEADTPVTVVENASRTNQKTVTTTVMALPEALKVAGALRAELLVI